MKFLTATKANAFYYLIVMNKLTQTVAMSYLENSQRIAMENLF